MTYDPATAIRDADDLDEVDAIHFYQPPTTWLPQQQSFGRSVADAQ